MRNDNMRDSGIEWIGEIPAEWDVTLLGSVFHQHQHKNVGLIEQNLLSLSYGRIVRKNMKTNDGLKPGSYETYNIINADDIVCRFTDLQNDQRSLRNAISTEHGIVTSAYLTIRSNDADNVDSRYVNYLLRGYDIKKVFYGLGAGVRQSLKWSEFQKLPLILPPLPEQRRIAIYLDSRVSRIDRLVDGLSRRVELLDEYKKSLISECVTNGIRQHENMKNSCIEWIGEIPAEWDTTTIDAIYRLRNEQTSDTSLMPLSITKMGVLPQLETAAKSMQKNNKRKIVHVGDFVINSRSDRRGSCGISDLYGTCAVVNTVMSPYSDSIDNNYYGFLFKTDEFADEFYKNGHGIVDDLWTTTWNNMRKIQLPLPPLPEQEEIAAFLDERVSVIDRLVDACRRQIDSLGEYKKSLISECVTGKRRIADADLEDASAVA